MLTYNPEGADGVGDDERMYQCYMYMKHPDHRQEPDANYYATPLPLAPVISAEHRKVIRIDRLPTGADHTLKEPEPYKHRAAGEYTPEQQKLRTDLKPLNVVQPDGASFKVTQQGTSNLVEWQKWSFRIGFNQRESTVLYNVSSYSTRSDFVRLLTDLGSVRWPLTVQPHITLGYEHPVRRPPSSIPQEICF